MVGIRWLSLLGLAAVTISVGDTWGQRQLHSPHIGYIYPAGGCRGTVFDALIGGQYLSGVREVIVSGEGVEAVAGEYSKPLTPKELNSLRTRLQKVRQQLETESGQTSMRGRADYRAKFLDLAREMGVTKEELEKLSAFRKSRTDPKVQINPQLAESVALRIRLLPNAAPGKREIRLLTNSGLSNPISFQVGSLQEYREHEPNDDRPDQGGLGLPMTVNGQVLPGDIDRFSFQGSKNTQLVVAVRAQQLIPYLADAVPGWFQAVVSLYDSSGKELAYADDFLLQPDPVLFFTIPEDGRYVLELRDAIYRGRQDFVYRVTIGEIPFVTSVFPLGGRRGSETRLHLSGWNLPRETLTLNLESAPQALRDDGEIMRNRLPLAVDSLPERFEQEPNDGRVTAQDAALPVIVNGRIGEPGDVDVFRLEGRAGNMIAAEVHARRLGSPLDSFLVLSDAEGRKLIHNDDAKDDASGLITHLADSRLLFTLPATGTYYLSLGDIQGNGGREYAYRLRISPPRPDFELLVFPSSISARAGMTVPITVRAVRKDGFSGAISLSLRNPPRGFALGGGWVPPNQDEVRLTLSAPGAGSSSPFRLQLEGTASIHGEKVRRTALPADDSIQAFAYHHLVPAEHWMVAVSGRRRMPARGLELLEEGPVSLIPGRTTPVRFAFPRGPVRVLEQIRLVLNEPPEGVSIRDVEAVREGMAILFHADAGRAEPGAQGNLIVDIFLERTVPSQDGKKEGSTRRIPLGSLPAIPFAIEEL